MIKELTQYIEGNTGLVIGTDLFAGHRPDSAPVSCTTVLETAGGMPDFYLPDLVEKEIEILCRAESYFNARDASYEVFNLLHGRSGTLLPIITAWTDSGEDAYALEATMGGSDMIVMPDPGLREVGDVIKINNEVMKIKEFFSWGTGYRRAKVIRGYASTQNQGDFSWSDILVPPETFSLFYVNTIQAHTVPQSLGQDRKGNYEFSTNFIMRYQNG